MMLSRIPKNIQCAAILALCAAPAALPQNLPEGPGKALLAEVCTVCHGLDLITSQKLSRAAWKQKVDQMVERGAEAKPEDFEAIVGYLAKNFAPAEAGAEPGGAPAVMPEGPGKQAILKLCTACHAPDHFTKYRKSREDWTITVNRMAARVLGGSREDITVITEYLIANYPRLDEAGKVNVNKSTAKQLEALGFTAEEADAIYRYHQEHGDFRAWGEMLVIYGVDGRKVESLKDRMGF